MVKREKRRGSGRIKRRLEKHERIDRDKESRGTLQTYSRQRRFRHVNRQRQGDLIGHIKKKKKYFRNIKQRRAFQVFLGTVSWSFQEIQEIFLEIFKKPSTGIWSVKYRYGMVKLYSGVFSKWLWLGLINRILFLFKLDGCIYWWHQKLTIKLLYHNKFSSCEISINVRRVVCFSVNDILYDSMV